MTIAGDDTASAPGRISTVIMPADVSWSPTQTMAAPVPPSPAAIVPGERIQRIAALAGRGAPAVLLLGGAACREESLRAASRIAAATGIRVLTETSPARLEHGAGLPGFPRLGFYPEQAAAQLKDASHVLLAGGARAGGDGLRRAPDPGPDRTRTPPDRGRRPRHRLRIQVRTTMAARVASPTRAGGGCVPVRPARTARGSRARRIAR